MFDVAITTLPEQRLLCIPHSGSYMGIGKAFEAGVPIFAGTDAGGVMPHGILGQEVELLAHIGGAEMALGAASWRARDWLGRPCLEEGASADLVVFDADPRVDLATSDIPGSWSFADESCAASELDPVGETLPSVGLRGYCGHTSWWALSTLACTRARG